MVYVDAKFNNIYSSIFHFTFAGVDKFEPGTHGIALYPNDVLVGKIQSLISMIVPQNFIIDASECDFAYRFYSTSIEIRHVSIYSGSVNEFNINDIGKKSTSQELEINYDIPGRFLTVKANLLLQLDKKVKFDISPYVDSFTPYQSKSTSSDADGNLR